MANSDENKKAGYIKLFRSMTQWEWYDDLPTFKLFMHLILTASHEDDTWHGIEIPRGSLVTSLNHLAGQSGLTIKQVRTALNKLIKAKCVANTSYPKYRVISVLNYDTYQAKGKVEDKQRANKGQSEGKQGATDNNIKNIRSKENIYTAPAPKKYEPKIYEPPGGDF